MVAERSCHKMKFHVTVNIAVSFLRQRDYDYKSSERNKMNCYDDEGEKRYFRCIAVTVLNPHLYLDTVVILGSIGGQFEGNDRIAYIMGRS